MIYQNIISIINNELAEITNIPVISSENSVYKPTLRQSFIRTTLIPSEPTQVTIGYDRTLRWGGLFQIDVFLPAGIESDKVIIDQIIAHFNTNRFLSDSTITLTITMPWRNPAQSSTDWYRVPVMLRWETFTQGNVTPVAISPTPTPTISVTPTPTVTPTITPTPSITPSSSF